MAVGHYLILLLPEGSPSEMASFAFWEEENINDYTAACTVTQLCRFFSDNKSAMEILTEDFDDFDLECGIQDLLIDFIKINHIAKVLLKPEYVKGDIIKTIIEEGGAWFGISIIDCRDTDNIRYSVLYNSVLGFEGYKSLSIRQYLDVFESLHLHPEQEEHFDDLLRENDEVSRLSRPFHVIPQDEIEKLFPDLNK